MKYAHILSPVQIGNIRLKSHITHSKCYAFNDPSEDGFQKAKNFYTAIAKNGAATVVITVGTFTDCQGERSIMSHVSMEDPGIQDKFADIVQEVHKYGTLCSASLMNVEPQNLAISDIPNWDAEIPVTGDYSPYVRNHPEISPERIDGLIEDYVHQCKELQRLGFDMVTIYMSYRSSILCNSLSPLLNRRTDKWGGKTIAERARLPLEVFRRIKEACGKDFLIEVQTSAEEEGPGLTVAEWLKFCKLCEGLVDIFQVRGWDGSNTHVNGYNSKLEAPTNLKYAEAFKKANIKALVAPVGGFGDPDMMEKFLAEGKADLISMARGLMVDYEFGAKLIAGRGEDVVPCVFCMKCNCPTCTTNPYQGLLHTPDAIKPVGDLKRVAVIGGGPAGMRAAIDAADRGHSVTLYEASDTLGGQLKQATRPSFKWPYMRYYQYLLRELAKRPIHIRLSTTATPNMIRSESFDAVICALGSMPKNIPVPGADSANVLFTEDVYGHEDQLGRRVVVIGGGESGRETALHLAQCGHKVTMLTRGQELYSENAHCISAIINIFNSESNLEIIEFAQTKAIFSDHITVDIKTNWPRMKISFQMIMMQKKRQIPNDTTGFLTPPFPVPITSTPGSGKHEASAEDIRKGAPPLMDMTPPSLDEKDVIHEIRDIPYDSLVICGGRTSRIEEARTFLGTAPSVYLIGDNVIPGSITECTSSAFAAAIDI